jgi:GNAT superfamily N-acetyltransferase
MIDIPSYYAMSPSSGFWILEYDGRCIGIIALDATPESISEQVPPKTKKGAKTPSSPIAVIRHFYVDEIYRKSGIQNDLLAHALRHAFRPDSSIERIKAHDSPLSYYIHQSLQSAGFHLDEHTETVGVFRWKLGTRILERAEWTKRANETR